MDVNTALEARAARAAVVGGSGSAPEGHQGGRPMPKWGALSGRLSVGGEGGSVQEKEDSILEKED